MSKWSKLLIFLFFSTLFQAEVQAQFDHPLFEKSQAISDYIWDSSNEGGSKSSKELLERLTDFRESFKGLFRETGKSSSLGVETSYNIWSDYVLLLMEARSRLTPSEVLSQFPDLRLLEVYFQGASGEMESFEVYKRLVKTVFEQLKIDTSLFTKYGDLLTKHHLRLALTLALIGEGGVFKPKQPWTRFFKWNVRYKGVGYLKGFWNEISSDSDVLTRDLVQRLMNKENRRLVIQQLINGGIKHRASDGRNLVDSLFKIDFYHLESNEALKFTKRIDTLLEKIDSLSPEDLRKGEGDVVRKAKEIKAKLTDIMNGRVKTSMKAQEVVQLSQDFNRHIVWEGFIKTVRTGTDGSLWGDYESSVKWLVGTKSNIFRKGFAPEGHMAFTHYIMEKNNYKNPEIPTYREQKGLNSKRESQREIRKLEKKRYQDHLLDYKGYIPRGEFLSLIDSPVKAWVLGQLLSRKYGETIQEQRFSPEMELDLSGRPKYQVKESAPQEDFSDRDRRFITRDMFNLVSWVESSSAATLVQGLLELGFYEKKHVNSVEGQSLRSLKSPTFMGEDWQKLITDISNENQSRGVLALLQAWKHMHSYEVATVESRDSRFDSIERLKTPEVSDLWRLFEASKRAPWSEKSSSLKEVLSHRRNIQTLICSQIF